MALLDRRTKLFVHIVQIFLILAATGLSAPRLFMKNQPRTRANTIALGMGAKSLIIIQYQLLTEHVRRFHKWKSLKAFAILNALEVVFWAAVVFLVIQANISICTGVGCILSWAVVGVAIVLTLIAVPMAVMSIQEFRNFRRTGQDDMSTKGFPIDSPPESRRGENRYNESHRHGSVSVDKASPRYQGVEKTHASHNPNTRQEC